MLFSVVSVMSATGCGYTVIPLYLYHSHSSIMDSMASLQQQVLHLTMQNALLRKESLAASAVIEEQKHFGDLLQTIACPAGASSALTSAVHMLELHQTCKSAHSVEELCSILSSEQERFGRSCSICANSAARFQT